MTDELKIVSECNVISFGKFDQEGEMTISIHNENTGECKTSWMGIKEAKDLVLYLLNELEKFELKTEV